MPGRSATRSHSTRSEGATRGSSVCADAAPTTRSIARAAAAAAAARVTGTRLAQAPRGCQLMLNGHDEPVVGALLGDVGGVGQHLAAHVGEDDAAGPEGGGVGREARVVQVALDRVGAGGALGGPPG